MLAAASAFPLLLIAQLAHVYFQYDVPLGGSIVYLDRAVYVSSLVAYGVWLWRVAPINRTLGRIIALVATLAIWAILLPRLYAMPIIWALQLGLLVHLALWAHASRRDGWVCGFVGVAVLGQAIGALTIMPLCQLGASPEWLALPQAAYVCNAVLGPALAALLPAGLGGVAWASMLTAALAMRRL